METTKAKAELRRINRINTHETEGRELVERRGANRKVYELGRGVTQFVLFPDAVHYREGGEWKDIDNTLKTRKSKGKPRLSTSVGEARFSFASAANDEDLVKATRRDGKFVLWGIQGATEQPAVVQSAEAEELYAKIDGIDRDTLRRHPRKLESCVRYADILPDTDMLCHVHGAQFKDEIILKSQARLRPSG